MAEGFIQVNVPATPGKKLATFEYLNGAAQLVESECVTLVDSSGNELAPLTDIQLRAVPVPVSGVVSTGGLTDAQLRATPVPVSGALTDAQLRAVAVPVSAASLPLPSGAATEATLATRTKPTDQQETIEPYLKIERDIQLTVIYVGYAARGSALNAMAWKIKRTFMDAVTGNPLGTTWTDPDGVWDDRTSETYS